MKTVNKKLFVIAVALVLSLSLGLTFAYFSDYDNAEGGASITLGGSIKIDEKVTDTSKAISMINTGDTDVLLRVKVIGPAGTEVKPEVAGDWYHDEAADYWYYRKVLPVGNTPASTLNATFSGDEVAVSKFDVLVVSDCVQVTYDYVDGENVISIPEGWNQDFLS